MTRPYTSDRAHAVTKVPRETAAGAPRARSEVEQVRAEPGLGVRDPQLAGTLVRGRQQAPDAARHGVLGERGHGELAQLLERRLLVREAQLPGLAQVLRQLVAK